jgi:glycolate oxidase FAD binding subunit
MTDLSESFIERVRQARAAHTAIHIVGGNTKSWLGRRIEAQPLEVAAHAGIVEYVPEELVLTARSGTTLEEIEKTLAAHQQQLGFEPPRFGPLATIGGTLASNLSGPARPWLGSVRDALLGIRIVSGRGEQLRFGGKVIKNVAGFDIARLQAGAHGAFGVLTEVSLKVLPRPERCATIVQVCDANGAIERMTQLAAQPAPLSGAAWVDGLLYVRLSGTDGAVAASMRRFGGDSLADAAPFWRDLKELALPFFAGHGPLWRFSVKPSASVREELGAWLLDWGGAQRYLRTTAERSTLEREAAGGHVTQLRGRNDDDFAQEPSPPIRALHSRLKQAFDPDRILNPGRLYSWL